MKDKKTKTHKVVRHCWAMNTICQFCQKSAFCTDSNLRECNENLFNITDCTSFERRKYQEDKYG